MGPGARGEGRTAQGHGVQPVSGRPPSAAHRGRHRQRRAVCEGLRCPRAAPAGSHVPSTGAMRAVIGSDPPGGTRRITPGLGSEPGWRVSATKHITLPAGQEIFDDVSAPPRRTDRDRRARRRCADRSTLGGRGGLEQAGEHIGWSPESGACPGGRRSRLGDALFAFRVSSAAAVHDVPVRRRVVAASRDSRRRVARPDQWAHRAPRAGPPDRPGPGGRTPCETARAAMTGAVRTDDPGRSGRS